MLDVTRLHERYAETMLFRNEKYPYIIAEGIENLFVLHRELICIKTVPTYGYLKDSVVLPEPECYSDIIQRMSGGKEMKINLKSKFHDIHLIYQDFDHSVSAFENKCANDCSQCCSDIFYVSETEFLFLLAELVLAKKYQTIYNCYKKSRLQEAWIKENLPVVYAQIVDTYPQDDIRYFNLGYTVQSGVSCPMLSDKGKCRTYKNRPSICRIYGTTSSCAIAGNPQNTYLAADLYHAATMTHKGTEYISQPRPIWYYGARYLKKENIVSTLQILKSFVEDSEEEFFEKTIAGKAYEKLK